MNEIRPQPGPQEAMLSSSADIMIGGGGAGGGKTWSLLAEPLRHIGVPGFQAVIFRRTYSQIKQAGGLWDASQVMYDLVGGIGREQKPPDWHFPTEGAPSVISFHHLQHEKDRLAHKGAEIAMLGFDQLEEITHAQFWYLVSRNRSTCGVQPYVRATCNPVPPDDPTGGWLHGLIGWWIGSDGYAIDERSGKIRWFMRTTDEVLHWFDSEFDALEAREGLGIPESGKEEVRPLSLTFIKALLPDNPILMKIDPLYASRLASMPRVERMRLREGNWLVRAAAGEIFDRAWFGSIPAIPVGLPGVRYWDKAGTKGGKGAESAGVLMLGPWKGKWIIADVVHGRWGSLERNTVIKQTAEDDGRGIEVWVEQEPGSGGKESAETTIRELAGWDVRKEPVTGSKVTRAGPLSAQAEAGNVLLGPGEEWNELFLRQAHAFDDKPGGLKDMIDAASGAFNKLSASTDADVDVDFALAFEGTTRASPWKIR